MNPSSAIWRTSSSGNRPVSSSSAAFGRTSFAAKFRAVSWIIRCSSDRSNVIASSPLSLSREVGLPFPDEGGDSLGAVFGGETRREQARLQRAAVLQVHVQPPIHRHLRRADGHRPPGEDLLRDLPGGG